MIFIPKRETEATAGTKMSGFRPRAIVGPSVGAERDIVRGNDLRGLRGNLMFVTRCRFWPWLWLLVVGKKGVNK